MAQNSNSATNEFWQNVRFGGGIGLSFGDGFFSGTLAPSAIYEFNNQFALGIGLNGTYAKRKYIYINLRFWEEALLDCIVLFMNYNFLLNWKN